MKFYLFLILGFLITHITSAQHTNYLYDANFNTTGFNELNLSLSADSLDQQILQCFYLSNQKIITISAFNGKNVSTRKPQVFLSRFSNNGVLDSTFGNNGHQIVFVDAIDSLYFVSADKQADDKIVIWVRNNNEHIIRYNMNGNVDSTFANNGVFYLADSIINFNTLPSFYGQAYSNYFNHRLLHVHNNKIIAGGIDNLKQSSVAVLNLNGTYDQSFNGLGYKKITVVDTNRILQNINVDNNEITIIQNNINPILVKDSLYIYRMDLNGSFVTSFGNLGFKGLKLHTSFGPLGRYTSQQICYFNDHRMLLNYTIPQGTNGPGYYLTVLKTDGNVDSTWGITNGIAKGFVYYGENPTDTKDIVIDLTNNEVYCTKLSYIIKFKSNGTLDGSFGLPFIATLESSASMTVPSGNGQKRILTNSMILQPDGKLVFAGCSDSVLGYYFNYSNHYKPKLLIGRLDTTCMHAGITGNVITNNVPQTIYCKGFIVDSIIGSKPPTPSLGLINYQWFAVISGNAQPIIGQTWQNLYNYKLNQSTSFFRKVYAANVCLIDSQNSNILTLNVSPFAKPIINLIGAPCIGDTMLLTCTNSSNKQWYSNNAPTGNYTDTFYATTSGIFKVIGNNFAKCDTSDAKAVTFIAPIPTTISLVGNSLVCNSNTIGYQWYDAATNLPIPFENSQLFTPNYSGTYYCISYDTNGCKSQSNTLIYFTLSLGAVDMDEFSVSPNPTFDKITVRNNSHQLTTYKLIDILGNILYTTQSASSGIDINLSNYKSTSSNFILQYTSKHITKFTKISLIK
jgi:uncharacterized delta-60 repeat protein